MQNKNVDIKHSQNKSVGEFEYKGYTYINLSASSSAKAKKMAEFLPNGHSTKVTAQNTLSTGKTAALQKRGSQNQVLVEGG